MKQSILILALLALTATGCEQQEARHYQLWNSERRMDSLRLDAIAKGDTAKANAATRALVEIGQRIKNSSME